MIEGFKGKLADEVTSLIEVPDDEIHQPGKVEQDMMDEDEGRQ